MANIPKIQKALYPTISLKLIQVSRIPLNILREISLAMYFGEYNRLRVR